MYLERVAIHAQRRPVVDADALLARVAQQHGVEIDRAEHTVALHLVVMGAHEAREEAQAGHPGIPGHGAREASTRGKRRRHAQWQECQHKGPAQRRFKRAMHVLLLLARTDDR